MPSTHELLRLARRIHSVYELRSKQSYFDNQPDWRMLTDYFHEVEKERRLIAMAQDRGWHLAASRHHEELRSIYRQFAQAVRDCQAKLTEPPHQQIPSPQDLFLELQHVYTEFDKVIVDRKKMFLAVHTDAIVLREINLGPFSVRLHWPRLATCPGADCFEVVALKPNPAGTNEDVTHPHVKSHDLCAGDAVRPLKKALEQGRLTDAFCMIRSVLETYNPHSAHVSLDNWEGITCWECGCTIDSDDRRYCESCSHDVCSECSMYCEHCGADRCTSCQARCGFCKEPCCPRCLKTSACSDLRCCPDCRSVCAGCESAVATNELDDETNLCPACLEAQPEPENLETDAVTPAASLTGETS